MVWGGLIEGTIIIMAPPAVHDFYHRCVDAHRLKRSLAAGILPAIMRDPAFAHPPRLHTFCDDILGEQDAVGLADLLRRGEVSPEEVRQAALACIAQVSALDAIAAECFEQPRTYLGGDVSDAPFAGVPMFVKDNIDLAGLPTRHGSAAVPAKPATKDEPLTQQILAQGFVVLGKSRLPEFGFSPSTEFHDADPTRNPWNLDYSSGGSSGGSAALVASGAVPIAHGNDGGGSIRIPAANNGLVGLKPTRGRLPLSAVTAGMPVKLVSDGVLTRSVRDAAHFFAAAERQRPVRKLPPVGLVEGPSAKRLRIGLVFDSIRDVKCCPETRTTVDRVAKVLEKLGHEIVPLTPPVPDSFLDDFRLYWGFLAFATSRGGKRLLDPEFDAGKLDGLTQGLANLFKSRAMALPLALWRLARSSREYAQHARPFDAVLSPVTTHTVPRLGHLSPQLPFEELFGRITHYTAFTPINNATGSPGIAVPAGLNSEGLPIGVHFAAAHGAERTLLDLAYQLEAEVGFPRINDTSAMAAA